MKRTPLSKLQVDSLSREEMSHTGETHTAGPTPLGEAKREQCLSKLGVKAQRAVHARAEGKDVLREIDQNALNRIMNGNNMPEALGTHCSRKNDELAVQLPVEETVNKDLQEVQGNRYVEGLMHDEAGKLSPGLHLLELVA